MADPVFEVWRVDENGDNVAVLDSTLQPETITRTLNEQDRADLSFPKNALTTADVGVLVIDGPHHREIQVRDTANTDGDGPLGLFWGPVVSATGGASDGDVKMHAEGVDWYLFRRFLDGTVTQYLSNPEFDNGAVAGFDGWSTNGHGTALPNDDFTTDTERFFLGVGSVKLVGTGGEEFVTDDFIYQSVSITAGALGLALRLSGWFYVGGATYSPGIEGRGLYIETRDGDDAFVANNYYPIDSATPRGQWIKASTSISIPPSTTYTVNVRCYVGAAGTTWWDDIKLVQYDSFGYVDVTADVDTGLDIGQLVCHLVDCLQNTDFGKSHLNIATDSTNIGKKVMKTYQFSDHVQFDQALEEYVNRDDGIDYTIIYNFAAGTRTFKNYNHRRGTDQTDSLTYVYAAGDPDTQNNLVAYRWTRDGANCITLQTVLGEDQGPDREEAEVVDATAVDGIILQDVRQAPQDTEVVSLLGQANARLNLFKAPPVALEVDVRPDIGYGGFLTNFPACGDIVHATINDGYFSVDADLRVHQMKLDCRTRVVTLTLVVDTLDPE